MITACIIVISVPKMTGMFFLVQRLGQSLLRMHREPISMTHLLRASLLHDTTELESRWTGTNLGFNHRRLERCLRREFRIVQKRGLPFQAMYIITGLVSPNTT